MSDLDKKQKEVQVARMKASLLDMEYKIMQRMEEIKRLEKDIQIQKEAIESLENNKE